LFFQIATLFFALVNPRLRFFYFYLPSIKIYSYSVNLPPKLVLIFMVLIRLKCVLFQYIKLILSKLDRSSFNFFPHLLYNPQ
jgi:hypothetical protein